MPDDTSIKFLEQEVVELRGVVKKLQEELSLAKERIKILEMQLRDQPITDIAEVK